MHRLLSCTLCSVAATFRNNAPNLILLFCFCLLFAGNGIPAASAQSPRPTGVVDTTGTNEEDPDTTDTNEEDPDITDPDTTGITEPVIPEDTIVLNNPVEIHDDLFGYNAEYMIDQCLESTGEISLLSPVSDVFLDQTCRTLVDEIDPGVLRFPGGTTANFYHYRGTGYGYDPAEVLGTTISLSELALDDIMPVNFIELFADLALQTESKVIFTMNLLTHFKTGGAAVTNPDSPAYQAKLTENMDALAYLADRGVDVVAVELGNELYFSWELTGIFNLYTAVGRYVELARDYASQIRARYPDIRIGIPGALVNSNAAFNYWNEQMQSAEFADAVVVHEYDRNIVDNCPDDLSAEAYFSCARSQVDYFLDSDYEQQLAVYMELFPDKELWLTEWGVGEPQRIANTFVDAYFVFNMFNKLSELTAAYPGKFRYANRHNLLTGGYLYPAFGTKFLNESDELYYLGNKAIRATAYPAKMLSPVFNDGFRYRGHTAVDGCRAWIYQRGASDYQIAVSNISGEQQVCLAEDFEELLEEDGLIFNSFSRLSAERLDDAAGISQDNQVLENLVNELTYVESIPAGDEGRISIPALSLHVIHASVETPPEPEPEPESPNLFMNIQPPVTFGPITVRVTSDIESEVELLIVNASGGTIVHNETLLLQPGVNPMDFNLDNFSAAGFGVYRVVVQHAGGSIERSFLYLG